MPVLADPKTVAGPLRAEDLDRVTNTGRIYRLDTHRPLPAGCDQQGRHRTREFGRSPWHDTVATDWSDCALEGGKHADPVPSGPVLSMRRHRQTRATVGLAIALAVVAIGYRWAWPLLGA